MQPTRLNVPRVLWKIRGSGALGSGAGIGTIAGGTGVRARMGAGTLALRRLASGFETGSGAAETEGRSALGALGLGARSALAGVVTR